MHRTYQVTLNGVVYLHTSDHREAMRAYMRRKSRGEAVGIRVTLSPDLNRNSQNTNTI